MATQRNFEIKNGLNVAGTERIASNGDITGNHLGTFGGTTVTRAAGTNNTQLASTAYVDVAISNLIDSSPGTLNTLNELAAALGDDASFSTTVTNSIATKAPLASPSFTGNIDVAGEIYVGNQDSVFAENVLRFNSAGASYIDHTTTGQSIRFRVSNSSALDTTPLILHSNGNAVFSGGIEAGTAGISTQDHRMPAGAGYITYSPANGGSDTLTVRKHGITQQFFDASGVSFPQGIVGIGTSSPSEELHVNSAVSGQHTRIHVTKTTTAGTAGISFNTTSSANTWTLFQEDASASKFYVYDGAQYVMTFDSANNYVGIGETGPAYPLHVDGTNVSSGGGLANLCLVDRTAYNGTNPGAGITFRGEYTSGGNTTNFATIQGIKENTTSGNYDTALRFTTRANNGNLTEKMRITSGGNTGFGTASPFHSKQKKSEITVTTAITSNAHSVNAGNNGGYDVSNDEGLVAWSGMKSITTGGHYNKPVVEMRIIGNMAANTWYPIATMSQLTNWCGDTGANEYNGFSMYFRIYTYDTAVGGGEYLGSRMSERIWVNAYTCNSTQRQNLHVGAGWGHAPNNGQTAAGSGPYQLSIKHHYNNDSYYPAVQTLEFLTTSAKTGLNGSGNANITIYGHVG